MNWKSQNEPEASYSYTNEVDGEVTTMGNERMNAHTLLCATDTVIKWTGNEIGKEQNMIVTVTIMDMIPTPPQNNEYDDKKTATNMRTIKQTTRPASSLTYHIT